MRPPRRSTRAGWGVAYNFFRFLEMAFGLIPPGADRCLVPFAILMSFPGIEIRLGCGRRMLFGGWGGLRPPGGWIRDLT